MKKKKGFVFIETIVVIVVLLTSLLYLYSTFVGLSINDKKRMTYDDVSYLYKTYSIKKYLVSQRLDRIITNLDSLNSNGTNFIVSFGCGSVELYDHFAKEASFCEVMSQDLHVANMYITYYDLSSLQHCEDKKDGLCTIFEKVNPELASYLKTLNGSGEDGYRLIIEYASDESGKACTNEEHCIHYFTSLKVGDEL